MPPAVAGDAGEQRELVDIGGGAGRIEDAGRQADRARVHAFAQQLDHPRLLGAGRRAVRIVHRRHPQRRMADQRRDVDRGLRASDRRDIGGHRRIDVLVVPPSRFNGGGTSARTSGARLMPQLPTMTVVTPCVIFGSILGSASTIWSSCVWTSMKPGATISPATSITSASGGDQAGADRGDAVAVDAHVGDEPVRAGAVDDGAAAEQERRLAVAVRGIHDDVPFRFDHADGSTGMDLVLRAPLLQHLPHALELAERGRPAAQSDAHHQDLEIGELREISLGAHAHRMVDRNDDRQHDVGQPARAACRAA